jgi:2'-hydroxyisoflavone reductase
MKMNLLVLGGTVFLGRHIVATAIERGHQVTVFNRGKHNPELFPEAEKLRGDRHGDLASLTRRRWDAVIDTSGHVPGVVEASARILSASCEHYTLISTLAVYEGLLTVPGLDETAPVRRMPAGSAVQAGPETMGALKAECENIVREMMGGCSLIVRAGILCGPHDPTDRFTYWPRRISKGGEVLVPGSPKRAVQIIDARDLAEWILTSAEVRRHGAYNATGPATPLNMEQLLYSCQAESGSNSTFTWVRDDFVVAACAQSREGFSRWSEFPLWAPGSGCEATVNCARAIAAGLKFRPLSQTIRDTGEWDKARPSGMPLRSGLSPQREAQLLEMWHSVGGREEPRRTAGSALEVEV